MLLSLALWSGFGLAAGEGFACSSSYAAGAGGEDWPRHRWALQVWAHWPHLAELELRPDDLLPPAQRALLPHLGGEVACPLGLVALRLFIFCSLSGPDQRRAVADNGDALAADLSFVLSCHLLEVSTRSGVRVGRLLWSRELLNSAVSARSHVQRQSWSQKLEVWSTIWP